MRKTTPTSSEQVPVAVWRMLALGVAAQAGGTLLICTPAYLIPWLHEVRGMPLTQAGLFAAAPTFGMVLTLVAWGALADHFGERRVIAGGLALTALFAFAAASVRGFDSLVILLILGGASAASTNAASGRVVVGWFPRPRRGLAMGIRQMAQPLGVAVAALVVPTLARRWGIWAPLLLAGVATAVLALACAIGVTNPPRPVNPTMASAVAVNPYSQSRFLIRIHLVSALLVVPQFTLSIFGLIWLISGLHWGTTAAGAVIAAAQLARRRWHGERSCREPRPGAAMGCGKWSRRHAPPGAVRQFALERWRSGSTCPCYDSQCGGQRSRLHVGRRSRWSIVVG